MHIEKNKLVAIKYIFILLGLFKQKEEFLFSSWYTSGVTTEGCNPMPKGSLDEVWVN